MQGTSERAHQQDFGIHCKTLERHGRISNTAVVSLLHLHFVELSGATLKDILEWRGVGA